MLRELRALGPYLRHYRTTFLFGLSLVVVSNYFGAVAPQFLQKGIDGLAHGIPATAIHAAWILVLVALVGGIARYGMRESLNSGSRRVETDLRDDLYRHLQRMSAEFYDRHPIGDVMARTTNDLLAVRMVAGPALMYIVDTVVRTIFLVPPMLAVSAPLTALALAPLIGLPIVMVTLGQLIHRRTEAIQAQFGTLTDFVREDLAGVRIVRAYGQQTAEIREFERLSTDYLQRNLALARVQGSFFPLLTLCGGLGAAAVLYFGGKYVMAGTVTPGAFVAFGVYLAMLVWPMIALGWAINLVQRGAASMKRINELFAEQPTITGPATPTALPAATGARALAFEDVWFRFPNAVERGWVLQNISFHVPAGGSLAIVGATGSGKSAIADLIVRTYDPDRGAVRIDGVDLRELALDDLRHAIGFVPQETFLFSDTVRGNVLLGAPDDGRLERVAETSQLAEAIPSLPQGYDTMLGERGINLSGGQKQRAAIARALAQDPPIFVLDDALSAVDAQTEARILTGLRDALRGRTSVVISHRLAAVRDADLILVLDDGKIVERGTHAELAAAGGRYWELLHRQELEEALDDVRSAPSETPA